MKKLALFIIPFYIFFSCVPEDTITPNSTDARDLITGTWNCAENSPTYGELNYNVKIYKDEVDSTLVEIGNFYELGEWSSVYAKLEGSKLTVSLQEVEGHEISGTGTITNNYKTINWIYQVTELNKKNGNIIMSETVTAVYTK